MPFGTNSDRMVITRWPYVALSLSQPRNQSNINSRRNTVKKTPKQFDRRYFIHNGFDAKPGVLSPELRAALDIFSFLLLSLLFFLTFYEWARRIYHLGSRECFATGMKGNYFVLLPTVSVQDFLLVMLGYLITKQAQGFTFLMPMAKQLVCVCITQEFN